MDKANNLNRIKIQTKPKREPSTLIVPDRLIPFLENRIKRNKNRLDLYFQKLLKNMNQVEMQHIPRIRKMRTKYQKAGQKPVRVNFRVQNTIWHQWKQMARYRGFSICFLFVLLLEKDYKNQFAWKKEMPLNYVAQVFVELFNLETNQIQRNLRFHMRI